jgi:hypothetical protein
MFHYYFGRVCQQDVDQLSILNGFAARWSLSCRLSRTTKQQSHLILIAGLYQESGFDAHDLHNMFISSFYSLIILRQPS